MKFAVTIAIAHLASLAMPLATLAQAPAEAPQAPHEQKQQQPTPPPAMQNRVNLWFDYTYQEEKLENQIWYPPVVPNFPQTGIGVAGTIRYQNDPQASVIPVPSPTLPLELSVTLSEPHNKITGIPVAVTGGGTGPTTKVQPLRLLGSLFGIGARSAGFLGLGGGGGGSVSGSASAPLVGPELDYTLPDDVTGWMPFEAQAQVFARALYGTMEFAGEPSSVQDYSGGVRLSVPLWHPESFSLAPYVSVGPGYLKTTFGHATGVDAALGLRVAYRVAKRLHFVGQIEIDTFTSTDLSSWGPAGTIGLSYGF